MKGCLVLNMGTRGRYIGVLGAAPQKWFSLSNSRKPSAINLKFGMWISLGERMVGIEYGHQGGPYGGARGRAPKMVSAL